MWRAEKIFAHMFCFFFIAQILSPMIGGKSLYIDFILVLINPFFLLWLGRRRISMTGLYVGFSLGMIAILGNPMTSIKIIFTLIEMGYLFYLYDNKLWYINRYISFSIIVALVQFYGLFFAPEISLMFSPEVISTSIWGSYAMITNPNFYSLLDGGLPHVSGLSREAGFMASLLLSGICVDYLFSEERYWKTSKISRVLYMIGYIITFTKISLLVLPLYIIHRFRRFIDMIPVSVVVFFWIFGMTVLWSLYQEFLLDPSNLTFLHRFGAYATLWNLDAVELLLGTEKLQNIDSFIAYTMAMDYESFAGFGGWLITNGMLTGMVYLLSLWRLHVTSTGLLLLLLLTINVHVDTNQNFVVLAYFIVFKYYRFDAKARDICVQKE